MVELADTQDLGSCGRPCRFESCYPHHKQKRSRPGPFCLSYDKIRTRTWEGIGVSENVRWTFEQPMAEAGLNEDGEGPGARAEGEAAGVLLSAP